MPTPDPKFDGLAENYERTRPRYPAQLFEYAVGLLARRAGSTAPVVVDAGAGTGIALEALCPLLPVGASVHAVDISEDMIRVGRGKFPEVDWNLGTAEDYLSAIGPVDLVVAAQAYQWMDRPAYVAAAAKSLRAGGVCMVIQNNRDHGRGGFAAEYEDLLEELSPGYSRTYRAMDVAAELGACFTRVERRESEWRQSLAVEDFVTMSTSSTQAQRAIASVGDVFLDRVRELCARRESAGRVEIPYLTEAFYAISER